jgi:hypothetical protein
MAAAYLDPSPLQTKWQCESFGNLQVRYQNHETLLILRVSKGLFAPSRMVARMPMLYGSSMLKGTSQLRLGPHLDLNPINQPNRTTNP